jgi:hypothetical protein
VASPVELVNVKPHVADEPVLPRSGGHGGRDLLVLLATVSAVSAAGVVGYYEFRRRGRTTAG